MALASTNGSPKRNMQWEDAIRRVLTEANVALHYSEIAEQIVAKSLRESVGATPAATVASILSNSLKDKSSPFDRAGRGLYIMKARSEESLQDQQADALDSTAQAESAGVLRAFGMFWQRSFVIWSGSPKMFGRQGAGATNVNFAEQIGVYLLHDRERVIYVGRAADSLFARLRAHTVDRLGGRWDRFSWFGLRSVDTDGKLSVITVHWNESVIIETLEALLIESLEPPLNRRRGDNLAGLEYVQVEDPQIATDRKRAVLKEMGEKL